MTRFNASAILNKLSSATKAVDASFKRLEDNGVDLVTKWFEAGALTAKMREVFMWNLLQQIEAVMDLSKVEDHKFANVVKPYFENYVTAESKAFAKLEKGKQLQFAKGWSEVVAVTKATGKKASERRKTRKETAKTAPTYRQVLAEAKALSAEEQNSLLMALARQLGISTKSLKAA